jgi:hypothetical protein
MIISGERLDQSKLHLRLINIVECANPTSDLAPGGRGGREYLLVAREGRALVFPHTLEALRCREAQALFGRSSGNRFACRDR